MYVLQCGDPLGTGSGGPGYNFGPIENAPADNIYGEGLLAMARRGGDANSQGSQFFIVYKDTQLGSDAAGGYTVFGKVTSGLDVVKAIAADGTADGSGDGQPKNAVIISSVNVK
jgi:peptidyl-prolyl cis-trans isomerase B (cyclophilin B)